MQRPEIGFFQSVRWNGNASSSYTNIKQGIYLDVRTHFKYNAIFLCCANSGHVLFTQLWNHPWKTEIKKLPNRWSFCAENIGFWVENIDNTLWNCKRCQLLLQYVKSCFCVFTLLINLHKLVVNQILAVGSFNCTYSSGRKLSWIIFTELLWVAPECLMDVPHDCVPSQKGDVYSFAIILEEIVVRGGPFEAFKDSMTTEGKFSMFKNSDCQFKARIC